MNSFLFVGGGNSSYISALILNSRYPNKKITIVPHSKGSSRHLFSILVKNRNNIIKRLKKKNINPGVHYKSILDFSYYKKKNYIKKSKDMKISKRFSEEILSLPMQLYLTKKDINKICNTINNET